MLKRLLYVLLGWPVFVFGQQPNFAFHPTQGLEHLHFARPFMDSTAQQFFYLGTQLSYTFGRPSRNTQMQSMELSGHFSKTGKNLAFSAGLSTMVGYAEIGNDLARKFFISHRLQGTVLWQITKKKWNIRPLGLRSTLLIDWGDYFNDRSAEFFEERGEDLLFYSAWCSEWVRQITDNQSIGLLLVYNHDKINLSQLVDEKGFPVSDQLEVHLFFDLAYYHFFVEYARSHFQGRIGRFPLSRFVLEGVQLGMQVAL